MLSMRHPRRMPAAAASRTEIQQQYLNPLAEDLPTRTAQAARGGAKIVVWSEAAAFVFKEDEALFPRASIRSAPGAHLPPDWTGFLACPQTAIPRTNRRS